MVFSNKPLGSFLSTIWELFTAENMDSHGMETGKHNHSLKGK